MVDLPRQIWCMWEPKGTLPPYMKLCVDTIYRNSGVPVRLISPEDLEDLAPDVDISIAEAIPRPGQRSDYYRAHLLAAQGGMWLDVDTIVFRDVNWIFDLIEGPGEIAARPRFVGIGSTPLAAPRGSEVMKRWAKRQEEMVRDGLDTAQEGWTVLGAPLLGESLGPGTLQETPISRVAAIPWSAAYKFTSRFHSPSVVENPEVTMLNLYNERFPSSLKQADEQELLTSRIMLSRALRVALGKSGVSDERYLGDCLGRGLDSSVRFARRGVKSLRRRARDVIRPEQPTE